MCQEITDKCNKLVDNGKKSPYAETTGPHVPKCNWFLNDVLKSSGIPVPWDANHPPDVHGMNKALSQDPHFDRVWTRDKDESTWKQNAKDFEKYCVPQDGDILI